jgi:hypothetical protein
MKFGINFFPSFRPEDSSTADYYDQCLRIAERADALRLDQDRRALVL